MNKPKTLKRDLQRLRMEIDKCRHKVGVFKRTDRSLAETYHDDATVLQAIHDSVVARDYQEAEYLANSVDTAVRDQIPVRLYNTICELAETAEGEITMKKQTKKTAKKASKKAAKKTAKKVSKKVTSKAKTAPAKGKDQKAPSSSKKLSCLDATAKVLGETTKALNTTEMFDAMVKKGYWNSSAPTPQNTIYAAILREINTKGKESRFCKVERGRFGLNK